MKITFEPYRRRTVLAQCYRCQRFGHSSDCCRLPFRCLRCSGAHRSSDCDKPRSEDFVPKCANCGGQHSANYKGCPLHKIKLEALKTSKPSQISRAPATATTTPKPTPPTVNKENFPALPNKPTPPPTLRRPWGPPKDQPPKETPAQQDNIMSSLKEISDIFKSLNITKILATIKETVQKLNKPHLQWKKSSSS